MADSNEANLEELPIDLAALAGTRGDWDKEEIEPETLLALNAIKKVVDDGIIPCLIRYHQRVIALEGTVVEMMQQQEALADKFIAIVERLTVRQDQLAKRVGILKK